MIDKPAAMLDAIADAIDADTIHLSKAALNGLRRVNAAIARQARRASEAGLGEEDYETRS